MELPSHLQRAYLLFADIVTQYDGETFDTAS